MPGTACWLPAAEGAGLSSPLLSPRSPSRLEEARPDDMAGFLGRAPERGGETRPARLAERGEVMSAEAGAQEADVGGGAGAGAVAETALKQGLPRAKCDEAALVADEASEDVEADEDDEASGDERRAAALTSRVRPGRGTEGRSWTATDGGRAPACWWWVERGKGFGMGGQASC